MKVLICNDDGVYAPGINILFNTLKSVCDVTMLAPLEERSTTGHTLTLDSPLRIVKIDENKYGCSGYPADCALMGIAHLLKDNKPDLVISGINRGANLGQDCFYSGTVASAREACFRSIPAISVSSVVDFLKSPPKSSDDEKYQTAADFIKHLVVNKCHKLISPRTILNINVPNLTTHQVKGVKVSSLGFRNYSEEILERKDFKGRNYYWIGGVYKGFEDQEGTDCNAVDDGYISLTPIALNDSPIEVEIEKWKGYIEELPSWDSIDEAEL